MAARAGLGIIKCCDGMDLPEIGAMALRDVIGPVVAGLKIGINAASRVAVEAELLIMTIRAVLSRFTRN